MADTAYQIQFRQEYIHGFEQRQSILRDSVTTEVQTKGNQATFLIADSGAATPVSRGVNGRIAGRPDNLTQKTITLQEWHDRPERTGFNLFASQGDGRRIMQETSMAVMNRKIDDTIIDQLNTGTTNTGTATTANLNLIMRAKTMLGNNKVPHDGMTTCVVTPAFMGYLHQMTEFTNADYVSKKPVDNGSAFWNDGMGYYNWLGIKWIEHPNLPSAGTSSAKCFMFHKSAIGHAAPSELIQTYAGYNEEHDYSYVRCSSYMGGVLLQNSGVIVINHDDSGLSS